MADVTDPSRDSGTANRSDETTLADGDDRVAPPRPAGGLSAPIHLGQRYEDYGLLGRGGMGEVRLCRDLRIGRKVALKVIREGRAERPRARARFVREAQIQGLLEHPAIVPVYDLAEHADGRIYFTMKRVFGRSLDEIIAGLREGEPDVGNAYSRRRLLELFARVCLAVDYVHQGGVIHRDLKPSNIMLGRYGEVYVLDWGLAKRLDTMDVGDDDDLDSAPLDRDVVESDNEAATQVGELVGTPGFMAPEQLDGGERPIDARADVYALGAVLFELLTHAPLHPRGSLQGRIGSTIRGADARCHVRAPEADISPELEAICVRATADDAQDRHESARALHDAVDAYLEGDRDKALRRAMADKLAQTASARTEALLDAPSVDPDMTLSAPRIDAQDPDGEPGWERERREALAQAARALALDPSNDLARTTVVRLVGEPPPVLPPALQASLRDAEWQNERAAASGGMAAFGAMLALVPGVALLGVRDWWLMALIVVAASCGLLGSWLATRAEQRERWSRPFVFAMALLVLFAVGRVTGALILVPGLAAVIAASFVVYARRSMRPVYIALAAAIVLVPLTLELLGVLPASYVFEQGRMIVDPHLTDLPREQTLTFLVLVSTSTVVVPSVLAVRARDQLRRVQRRLGVQLWQLEQLLPRAAKQMLAAANADAPR